MQRSSPANGVLNEGSASMHRTAYGLFVRASNGAHLFGKTVPPGLYCRPFKGKAWHPARMRPSGPTPPSGSSGPRASRPPSGAGSRCGRDSARRAASDRTDDRCRQCRKDRQSEIFRTANSHFALHRRSRPQRRRRIEVRKDPLTIVYNAARNNDATRLQLSHESARASRPSHALAQRVRRRQSVTSADVAHCSQVCNEAAVTDDPDPECRGWRTGCVGPGP